MKKELDYFQIDGAVGWNQDWFTDWSMYGGGCGAVTACDLCIQLSRQFGINALYPYNAHRITRQDYTKFSAVMKPYLHPRWQGIDTLDLYLSGLSAYWRSVGVRSLKGSGLPGTASWQEARELIRDSIDAGIPVPCLLLYHKSCAFKNFEWHWFNLAGYEERDEGFYVRAITYGTFYWLNLQELWDTGQRRKGGLIRIDMTGV